MLLCLPRPVSHPVRACLLPTGAAALQGATNTGHDAQSAAYAATTQLLELKVRSMLSVPVLTSHA